MLENRVFLGVLTTLGLTLSSLEADSLGSLLFHGNCITCHEEVKAVSAPSVMEFRENYLRAFPQKKDFVEYMSKWVEHPDEQKSIMQNAIKKYDLMPELAFEKSTLELISEYIYETDFSKVHEGHEE